jgi:hypothetical protein
MELEELNSSPFRIHSTLKLRYYQLIKRSCTSTP